MEDINRVMQDRRRKLDELRAAGTNPFANGFAPTATCQAIHELAEASPPPDMNQIPADAARHAVAGRVMAKNVMGKAMFLRIRDRTVGVGAGPEHLQLYLRRDEVGADVYNGLAKKLDVGDTIGAVGPVFKTRTGETTVFGYELVLLTKSLRPLPAGWHSLADVETRYRQRYVDLIVNPEVKQVFRTRSQVTGYVRRFFEERDFLEVETPMMQPIPGGATARPFETFHNALGVPLYLRIAPELYLKRLVVGGLERVFEINRNFRNEGLSPKHNPEFTMLEFYWGYATYEDLIELTEELLSGLVLSLNGDGTTVRSYDGQAIDYKAPFARTTIRESLTTIGGLPAESVGDREALVAALAERDVEIDASLPYGLVLMEAFDAFVEPKLLQPTFVTEFPIESSPLARRSEDNPDYTDRFELFVAGAEIANGFSELNDPDDQRERFEEQVRARDAGDKEAMYMDLDYVRALEYGMPPTAGEGIGIDRLTMLMTDQQTIREVIFFPHMRPE